MSKRPRNAITPEEIAVLAEDPFNTEGHADGIRWAAPNLFVQFRRNSLTWVLRFQFQGKTKVMGLGPLHRVPFAEAKRRASKYMRYARDGFDPTLVRHAEREAAQTGVRASIVPLMPAYLPAPSVRSAAPTFHEVASDYLALRESKFKDPATAYQWRQQFKDYVYPMIGVLAVDQINVDHIVEVLAPLWWDKNPTARKVRQRVEAVLDYAAVENLRSGANPAAWSKRGALPVKLGGSPRHETQHFTAMPYTALPGFWKKLAGAEGTSACALRFLILTAVRSSEARGGDWSEIDTEQRVWTIPGTRMKSGRTHRVPLADAALALLESPPGERTGLVFPGAKGKPLTRPAMVQVLRRLGSDATPHGMRSAFADWAREVAKADREVRELALAHKERNEAVAAYSRSDLLERRRELMASWAAFVAGK
jgi:integrase